MTIPRVIDVELAGCQWEQSADTDNRLKCRRWFYRGLAQAIRELTDARNSAEKLATETDDCFARETYRSRVAALDLAIAVLEGGTWP